MVRSHSKMKIGKINPSIIGDYINIEYPDRRQFPDDETVNRWKSLGHLYVNYTGLLREEYREFHNGVMI